MTTRLRHVADIVAGQAPSSDDVVALGDGIPFLQGNAEFGPTYPIPKYECARASKKARAGDVLVSVRAPVGAVNLADRDLGIGRGLAAIHPLRASGPYLRWLMEASARQLRSRATGSTFEAVTAADLADLLVPIPFAQEQRAIADFLDRETAKIDALIEKQKEMIDLLRARREVVVWSLALGQKQARARMSEWFGSPPTNWIVDKLGRHARVLNGSTPSRENMAYWEPGTFPWLNSSNANLDRVTEADQFVSDVALAECHLPRLEPGAVLVGITGQGRTRGMATQLTMQATINQHLAALIPNPLRWDSRYLTHLMRAAYAELRFISDEAGSTKGALTCAALEGFRVPRPPLSEQRAIAERLDFETGAVDALIAKAQEFVELAKERRAALITAAVTGQIDLSRKAG